MKALEVLQPVSCQVGFHVMPEGRMPPGPVVWTCPCCRSVLYCYGYTVHEAAYTNLMLPNFPRLLKALPAPAS